MKYASIDNTDTPPQQQRRFTVTWTKSLIFVGLCVLLPGLIISSISSSGSSFAQPSLTSSSSQSSICTNGHYSKTTLKPAVTYPFISLFPDTKGANKFEGSDVIYHDGYFYAIADSLWSILSISSSMTLFGEDNEMIGDPFRDPDEESGYEALFLIDDIFYVVRESIQDLDEDGEYHAIVEELSMNEDRKDYTIQKTCKSSFGFEGDSKGFEGAVGLKSKSGELYLLGLCEGNHCREGKIGKERGNGRVVVLRKTTSETGCSWDAVTTLSLPSDASFQDYSAISVNDEGRVAVTSQEDSALWTGYLTLDEEGFFDPDIAEFKTDKIMNFPRDDECRMVYCNIEGIHWVGENQVVAVSDKMKNRGKQDFRCFDLDQSIHIFALP
ncbi:hypothetical protein TrST_g13883 [Triparma strigata]|uniref:Uncharacterized protein n=1 Tax=Triparma strigata TaxID=1606541 RepID=A0A9W7EI94_9STRA|nr:hypothetical protein TrST_g13883 [Triparma strigata]